MVALIGGDYQLRPAWKIIKKVKQKRVLQTLPTNPVPHWRYGCNYFI
jgi:ABC-type Fe3+-hydroxamate transport system substrate-binding protein